jgi:hypothetical protein
MTSKSTNLRYMESFTVQFMVRTRGTAAVPVVIMTPDLSYFADFFPNLLRSFSWLTYGLIPHDLLSSIPLIYSSKPCFLLIPIDLIYTMLYPVLGKVKPLGLMAPSWHSFQTSSMDDDDREAQCLSPKNKEDSFESYDSYYEDWEVVIHQQDHLCATTHGLSR